MLLLWAMVAVAKPPEAVLLWQALQSMLPPLSNWASGM